MLARSASCRPSSCWGRKEPLALLEQGVVIFAWWGDGLDAPVSVTKDPMPWEARGRGCEGGEFCAPGCRDRGRVGCC